jgi:hypothetical protein
MLSFAAAATCIALTATNQAQAQSLSSAQLPHVICFTNETSKQLLVFVDETPEASGPRTGFGAFPNASYCYRRVATRGSAASIAIDDRRQLSMQDIHTAADFDRLAAQMQAQRQLPAVCGFAPSLVEQADVEQRQAVLVRLFAADAGYGCSVTVGVAPANAGGADVFDAMRGGAQ